MRRREAARNRESPCGMCHVLGERTRNENWKKLQMPNREENEEWNEKMGAHLGNL